MTGARERRGLTAPEVAAGLRRDGPNVLPAYRPPSPVLLLARQMTHFFALLLWVAAGLAYLGGMPQLAAAVVVVAGIAALTRQAHRRPGPLALQLRLAVMIIAVIAVSVGVVFFGVAIGLGMPRGGKLDRTDSSWEQSDTAATRPGAAVNRRKGVLPVVPPRTEPVRVVPPCPRDFRP